jgi:hypothetical protein
VKEIEVRTPVTLSLIALFLANCAITDPYTRPGVWRPERVNEADLRVMVVSPADLALGVAAAGGDGQQAAAALDRMRNDKPRVLPNSGLAKIVPIVVGGSQSQ